MNTTFTNYAEKKAKQFLNLLQGYTKGIRMTAILLLLLMGVSNAWGYNFKNPHIYFNNADLNLNPAMLLVGHNTYSIGYNQTKNPIDNTKLVYFHPSANWGDQDGFTIGQGSNWGADGSQSFTKRAGYLTNHIGLQYSYNFDDGKTYYVTGKTGNSPTITVSYKANGYNDIPKYNAIQSAKVRTTTSGSYSTVTSGNWPATLKLKGTYLSGDGASGRSEISSTKSTDGDDKKVYGAVVTGLITHSYSNISDDYQFDGWIKGSGTSLTSTNSTYSYNITAATTVYACFTKKYAVTFGASGNGDISAKVGNTNITSGNKIVGGSKITFTATPSAGYQIEGWYSNAGCTTSLNNGTSPTYTVNNLTGATTVYVKFEEIPEEKFAVTIQTNNANYGTVSPSGLQQVGKSGINITATAETGYQFDEWTCTDGVSVEDASDPNTTASATKEGTVTANFSIKNYPINYNLNGGTNNISNPASYTVETETITLQDPTKEGFLFAGWYTSSTFSGTAVTSITKGSTGDKTYYAKWIDSRDCIFFYNNLGWSNVYVYFYNDAAGYNYWADGYGTGANKQQQFWDNKPYWEMEHGTMTQIKGTNIWYYYATYIKTNKRSKVSFANVNQSCDKEANNTNSYFQNAKVVYRADLDYEKRLPMFVPHTTQSHYFSNTKSTYYNHGYWMNYPTNTGYTLKIYDKVGDDANEWKSIPFEYSEDMAMPLTLSVSGMEGGKTYGFKILRADNTWYGNNSTMTTGHSGDAGQTAWEFTTDTKNCGLTTTAAGTYVFTLKYGIDRNSNYNYLVGVEYPASVGDYRLAYDDDTHPFHPGHLLKKRDGKDTVSFFVHHDQDLHPVIMLQEVTAINATTGEITWNTISTTEINGISATGIYNFILEQSGNVATLLTTITEYDGDFYIRTDATAGGWGNFRQKSNKMTYTSYAENQKFNFNHYFVEWINAGTNVKFTIANDYSYCLSDSLNADDIVTTGNLPANANVRFGWNSKTNELSRAYISGSSNVADRYLVLTGDDKLTDMDDKNFNVDDLNPNEAIFKDMGNWIYQLDAKAGRGASIQLTARYNEKDQTFFNTSAVALAEEGNETTYPVRFIYDFKTNNLMAAWLLEEENQNDIAGDSDLNANMLLLRRHHNQAQQIQLSNTLRAVGTAYGVMTFEKDFVNDTKKSIYERALYWVSFPFDVRIRDVFGFGEYMDTWIMEYYDGEARAKNGAWVDSESYWTYITDLDYVLKAGVGYVLCLDLDKMGADSKVFEHTSEVSLYFPSATAIGDIDVNQAVSITVPGHQCEIIRPTPQGDRHIADSHWNVIGVPRFINLNITLDGGTIDQQDVVYYYQYNASNNTYQAAVNSGSQTFQTMQAYMVQYAGTIDWWEMANWTPQQLAARRNANATSEKVNLRLEIAQDDVAADKTFIQLQEEGATADFDMNKDLTKIINAGTNIYTIVGEGNVLTAGNVMPMSECVVPVGVKVDAEGEYTFRMPDGTEGMVVELIDYELETKTNLLLFDYTVDLSAGTYNDRFALHIQPNKSGVTTGVEGAYPQPLPEGKGTKFLIDGKLMIRTAEGVIYDAQGHVVQ